MQVLNQIPIPVKRNWKEKLDKLQISESMIISNQYNNSVKAAISKHFNSRRQKTFTTARQTADYFRVWRVK